MESSGMVLPRSTAAELGLPGYPEPGKLNYGTEKGCPWRGSEGCLGPGRELAGGRLGCPYPLAPPCLQDALCRPKDGAELPPLLPPRNGQPKAGWAEPCKERPGPRWAEAVLAPLALYSHCPSTTGKPRVAAGDGAGDPLSFRHCPFLVEAKHSPFLLSSLLPTGPPADPPFGGSGCKAAPAPFDGCSSSGKKVGNSGWLCRCLAPMVVPEWGSRGSAPRCTPAPLGDGELQPRLNPAGNGGLRKVMLAPTPRAGLGCTQCWRPTAGCSPSLAPAAWWGVPASPRDGAMRPRRMISPLGPGEPDPSSPLVDGHYPPALAKPEPPPACLCTTSGCEGCPGVGCEALGSFEPTLGIPGGHFPCPPSNHTKLKKTWLTRHSEQSLPRCKAPRRDGGSEPAGEGKRSAKRPHGTADGPRTAGEGARAAKRGTKATEHMAMVCPGEGTESRGDPEDHAGPEPWCLQSVPCTALPESIPRCCACAARAVGFAFGDGGELSVDGFFTLGEAEGEMLQLEAAGPERGSRSAGSSLCLAKYLLGVLGDPFCEAVRRDRDTWPGAPGRPEAPQLCDACQRGFFNSHWSCTRCGFQLCPDCHRSRREADSHGTGMGGGGLLRGCQLGWGLVLTRLWKLLHEVRVKFSIESHCPCREGAAERMRAALTPFSPPAESPEGGPPSPGQPPPRGAVQTTTLCDLLASTAVKLCLGQDGVRMAFAPVSPALPSVSPRVGRAPLLHAGWRALAEAGEWLWGHGAVPVGDGSGFTRMGTPLPRSLVPPPLASRVPAPAAAGCMPVWDAASRAGGAPCLCHRAANLSASLPLPEYCGPAGRLNLATYLRGQRGRRWLRPRVCVAYGVQPQDRTIGTKNLMVEAADSISILVHAAARLPARQVDALLKERLWDAGSRPGALWHIFRAEDAGRIQDFLQKVGQEGAATAEPPGRYLDLSLRRRLREECGVSGWTLLQFLGDAVLVPAGAPHQVGSSNATRLRVPVWGEPC
uniref:Lysine-specific demethylase n=1 Tax=Falco tinnunculus TaxID=100819 RepID=A0A8C4VBP9_FALTI